MSTFGRERAPWEDYSEAVIGKDDPKLEAAVEEYSRKRHDAPSSAQNDEELARWREGNAEIAKEYQWVTPEEYADIGPRIGRILSYSEFITILRNKCGLKCFYREMGHPQKIALWAFKPEREFGEPEVVGWVQRPYQIEYEVMRFDDKGVPLDSRFRGWRTTLLALRLKGFLSEEKINKAFGRAEGPASGRYNSIMQSVRKNF